MRRLSAAILAAVVLSALSGCESDQEKFARHLYNAEQQLASGNPALASVEIRNAIRLDPESPQAHYLQARVQQRQEDWPAVLRSLQRVVELDPEHVAAHRDLAAVHIVREDLDRARTAANRALELRPDDPENQATMANVLLHQGEPDEARRLAEAALSSDAATATAFAVLAGVERGAGNPEKARAYLLEGIAANPDNVTLRVLRLQLAQQYESRDRVIKILQDIIEAFPSRQEFYRTLASLHLDDGKEEEALRILHSAIDNNPESGDARLALIQTLARIDLERALSTTAELIEAAPPEHQSELRLVQAELQHRHGNLDLAESTYQQVATADDEDAAVKAYTALARLALAKSQAGQAKAYLDEALAVDARNFAALELKTQLHLGLGETDQAKRVAQRAVDAYPGEARGLLLMGRVYRALGVGTLARNYFERALENEPQHREAALAQASLYIDQKRHAQARSLLEPLLQRDSQDHEAAELLLNVYMAQRQWESAQALLNGPLSAQSTPAVQSYLNARVLRDTASLAESTAELVKALDADPEYAPAVSAMIENHRLADTKGAGIDAMQRLLERHPDARRPALALAAMQSETGDLTGAFATLDTLQERHQDWMPAYHARMRLLLRQGEVAAAVDTGRNALSADPKDTDARLMLAGIHEQRAEYDTAIDHYQAILEADGNNLVAANNLASLLIQHREGAQNVERAHGLISPFRDSQLPAVQDTLGWIQVLRGNPRDGERLLEAARQQLPANQEVLCHLVIARHLAGTAISSRDRLDACTETAESDESVKRLLADLAAG